MRAEFNGALSQGEEGVVATATHVVTGVEVGAALTHEDLASVDQLTTEALNTQTLGVTVATVSGARSTLFVGHETTFR
jgi:hypothetical protein